MSKPEARGPEDEDHERAWRPAVPEESLEGMRHEAAVVVGDAPFVLAHSDAGGLTFDHPGTDQRMIAVEHRQRLVALPDEALAAVIAARGIEHARSDDGDVVAL